MTLWTFEPNGYVDMQSQAIGIPLWFFSHPSPYVRKVQLRKEWEINDASLAPVAKEQERSEEELKAHAIN